MKPNSFESITKSIIWLGILAFFSVFNETVFTVSLPDIADQFGISPSAANWINTSFIFSFAIGSVVYGKISDWFGLRKLLLFGLLTYGAGSILGILLHSWYPAVLFARFIQGAGAAAVPALIMVIVARYFEPNKQGKAFGMIGSIVALGEGIGPVIGGIISDYIHWSFLFTLPMITLVTLPFFLHTLPDEPAKNEKFDWLGMLWLSVGIVAFTLFTALYLWIFFVVSLLFFICFARHIRRVEHPFLDPSLFRKKRYIVGLLTGGLLLGAVAGFISLVPYLIKEIHHLSTSLIGSGILFPGTISVIFLGFVGGIWVDKRGYNYVMFIGLCMISASFLIVSLFADQTPWLVTCALVLTFGGLSFVKTVVSTSVAEALGPDESGSGMGFLSFACFLAEGIGVAIVGGLLTSPILNVSLLPTITDTKAFLYSNVTLILLAFTVVGGVTFLFAYRKSRS